MAVDVQIFDETAYDADLLCVFLAKESFIGAGQVDQFRYDRRYAAEVDGSRGAAEFVCEIAFDSHIGAVAFGIHLGRFRMEDGIDADGFHFLFVFGKAAGIFLIVFVRAELGRVDEDGSDDDIAFGASRAHQGQMAFMQGAHGRYEADGPACFFGVQRKFLDFFDSTQYFHSSFASFQMFQALISCGQNRKSHRLQPLFLHHDG